MFEKNDELMKKLDEIAVAELFADDETSLEIKKKIAENIGFEPVDGSYLEGFIRWCERNGIPRNKVAANPYRARIVFILAGRERK